MKKVLLLLVSIFSLYIIPNPTKLDAKNDIFDLDKAIVDLINWKKNEVGAGNSDPLINDVFLQLAGTTPGDWYPIGLGRYNYPDDYNKYLAVISENVTKRYQTANKLDQYKATEWHRISLAITAMGGDPSKIGAYKGEPINLISDGTYNRGITMSPGRQGINGWIWGLIALDSKRYEVPFDAFNSRGDFIVEIIKNQLADGGFALYGDISDPDITAMAIQALAPYYNSEIVFSYASAALTNSKGVFLNFEKTIKQVVDESLNFLSTTQSPEGDFYSWGMPNVESTAQVIIALASLGVNPYEEESFIKNGNTLIDGIMKYRLDNGGFLHSFVYDPDNPTSKPDEANTMASEQVLYTLVSLDRYNNGQRTLYDMREEFTLEQREKLDLTIAAISLLNDKSTIAEVDEALKLYSEIPELERSYITNYWTLSGLAKKYNLKLPKEEMVLTGKAENSEDILLYFSLTNKKETLDLYNLEVLTTKYFTDVVNLRYILDNSGEFNEKAEYEIMLDKLYNEIKSIQDEIASISEGIKTNAHPITSVGLQDKEVINDLMFRYQGLDAYDQEQINGYEDLLKAHTKIKNLEKAIIISIIFISVAVVLIGLIFINKRRRKLKKLSLQMPESDE